MLGKVWDTVHPTENLWYVLLLMSTKCSASQKKRRERQDNWKARWKICKWSLVFPTSSNNIKKTIQGRDLSLPNIKHFQWDKKPKQFFLNSFYAVHVPGILMEMDFQRLRFVGWWFTAGYKWTFQARHHILPQGLSGVTSQHCWGTPIYVRGI